MPRPKTPSLSISVVGLLAFALLAVGVVVGLQIAPVELPRSVGAATAPSSAPVSTDEFTDVRRTKVVPDATATTSGNVASTGVVTRLSCEQGGVIASGSSPLTLDDRPILALATAAPPWRDLSIGSKGPDVLALQTELTRLGHLVPQNGLYGASTAAAVKALFANAGATQPATTLPLGSVMWLSRPQVAVEACDAALGTPFGGGTAVTIAGDLRDVRLVDALDDLIPGDRVARFDGVEAPVTGDTITDPSLLAAILASDEYAAWKRTSGSEPLTIEFVLKSPLHVGIVPPGALFDERQDGSACVRTPEGSMAVKVASSSLGQTLVTFDDGQIPARVLLSPNPSDGSCR